MARFLLAGKTALVTGAAKRLGRAIAKAFADAGASVVVHYSTSQAEAQALCRDLQQGGVRAWPLQADLTDQAALQGLIARAVALAGPLHVLVNNASVYHPSTLADVSLEDITGSIALHAWAPLVLSREFAAQGVEGAIINMLDARMHGGDRRHIAYILSKNLLAELTRMMALEFAPRVRVCGVAPGLIIPPPGEGEEYPDSLASRLPLQRHGDPEDVAQAVVFLAKSGFITGEVIYLDGGRHAREGGGR